MRGDAAGHNAGALVTDSSYSDDAVCEYVDVDRAMDRPREACGVFGIYAPGLDVARITYFGLYALQHRGQESAGIVTTDGEGELSERRDVGLVNQVFTERDLLALKGFAAIGHTRYSTTGSNRIENVQPVMWRSDLGPFAIGHNGNLTNTLTLRDRLTADGDTFETTSDTEIIAHLLARAPGADYVQKLRRVMPKIQGAYSLIMLTPTSVIAVRDPFGVRPLCLGERDGHWVVASETCAFPPVGAKFVREVNPGEIVVIEGDGPEGIRSLTGQRSLRSASCLFEYIYFARPDSVISGRSLYLARQRMGAELAKEFDVQADLVIGVPESATPAAAGYANARGLPYAEGLIKNRYIQRTFIQPDQHMRAMGAQMKYNAVDAVLAGKRVIVIDDSIVRGTTVKPLVKLLRDAGAVEVHMGISSPPFAWPCYLGLDVAKRSELIAARLPDADSIAREVGADSLRYLSLDGLTRAIDLPPSSFCVGCFTGKYPVPIPTEMADKFALETTNTEPAKASARHEAVGSPVR
ncbi:MAG TPA: amidophosphoribosyltransferase [Ktedonobacterales bacterium]|nr:amidophosphoribosyltransferase [Ktedonobacterales bacterium]